MKVFMWKTLLSQELKGGRFCFEKSKEAENNFLTLCRDPELISSEGGQDTSARQISGHSLHVFSRKCLETPNLTRFTKSK